MSKSKVYLSLDDLHKLYGISPEVIKQIKKKRKKRRKRKQLKQLASEIKSTNEQMKGYSMSRNNALEELKIESHLKSIEKQNKKLEEPLLIDDEFALTPQEMVFAQQMKEGIKKGEIKYNPTKTGISLLKPNLRKPRMKAAKEVFINEDISPINPLAGQKSSSMLRKDPKEVNIFEYQDDNYDEPLTQGSDFFIGTPDDTIYPITEQNTNNESILLGDDDEALNPDNEAVNQDGENYVQEEDAEDEVVAAAEIYNPKSINEYTIEELKTIVKKFKVKQTSKFNKQQIYDELYNLKLL